MDIAWYEYVALSGFFLSAIWGGVSEHRRKKARGTTRQSYRPEPFDKRLEDKY